MLKLLYFRKFIKRKLIVFVIYMIYLKYSNIKIKINFKENHLFLKKKITSDMF